MTNTDEFETPFNFEDYLKNAQKEASGDGARNSSQQKESTSGLKFKMMACKDLVFSKTEKWRIEQLLPETGIAAIYAESQKFKTFILLDMVLRIAAGLPWGERETLQGPVLYIAAEGAGGIKKRIEGWLQEHPEVNKDIPFYLQTLSPNLGGKESNKEVLRLIKDIEEQGLRPTVICVDTLAQTLGGGDESGIGMMTLVANVTALAQHFEALIVLVHHVGLKDVERLRGSSSLIGALDASLFVSKDENTRNSTLKVKKAKDEEGEQEMSIVLKKVFLPSDDDQPTRSTLVVESITEMGGDELNHNPKERNKKILQSIKDCPGLTNTEYAVKTGQHISSVQRGVKALKKLNFIKNGLSGGMEITKAGKASLAEEKAE